MTGQELKLSGGVGGQNEEKSTGQKEKTVKKKRGNKR